jgi:hypothetical protein
MISNASEVTRRTPWNKGKIVGQKAPFKLKDIWAIRVRLQLEHRTRELALFDLGIDSKLRSCDLLKLKASEVCHGNQVALVQRSCSRRLSVPFSSRSLRRRVKR